LGERRPGDDRWYEKFVPIADRILEKAPTGDRKEGDA